MITKTQRILNIISEQPGIKCHDIALAIGSTYQSTSGMLSTLKHKRMAMNTNGTWYIKYRVPDNRHGIVIDIVSDYLAGLITQGEMMDYLKHI